MSETTDIEKKSLEAHVELCAERYRYLEQKMDTIEEKISTTNTVVREIHDQILAFSDKRNNQIMAFGLTLTGTLIGIIGYLLVNYVLK